MVIISFKEQEESIRPENVLQQQWLTQCSSQLYVYSATGLQYTKRWTSVAVYRRLTYTILLESKCRVGNLQYFNPISSLHTKHRFTSVVKILVYTQSIYANSPNALVYTQTTYTNLSHVRFLAPPINIEL